MAVSLDRSGQRPSVLERQVSDEAFQAADAHWLQLLADDAQGFALGFLWADAAANGGQHVVSGQDVVGFAEVVVFDGLDEPRDVDGHWAACGATGILALDASGRFRQRLVLGIAKGHLIPVAGARCRILFRHGGLGLGDGLDGLFRSYWCFHYEICLGADESFGRK